MRARSFGLVALSALALAACGGSSGGAGSSTSAPAPLPAGFARFAERGVSFGHPRGWTRGDDARNLVEFYGAQGAGGLPPQVALGSGPARNTLAATVSLHNAMQRVSFPDYAVTAQRDVAVAGARAARRVDARYSAQRPGRARVRLRQVDLFVLTRDGRALDFFVRAPASDFDAARLGLVFDSFRLA